VKSSVGADELERGAAAPRLPSAPQHTAPLAEGERFARRSRLVRYVLVGYTLLIAYASLYPFEPWHAGPDNPLGFLFAEWPRYYTLSDVVLNLAAYGPLGFFLALALLPRMHPRNAALIATLCGTALSIVMEVLQNFAPLRVSSNLDVLTNGLGAMLGALLAVAGGERWLLSGHLYRLRQRVFLPGSVIDVGFVLLLTWLFTQLNPEVWLFGNGELRPFLALPAGFAFTPASYRALEASVTAVNLAGVCLLVSALARERDGLEPILLGIIAVAFTLKGLGALALFRPGDPVLWLTPGAMLGLPAGLVLYLVLVRHSHPGRAIWAGLLIVAGWVLVNVAPDNPYLAASIRIWRHGHFLSFSGLTQLVAALWPAAACGCGTDCCGNGLCWCGPMRTAIRLILSLSVAAAARSAAAHAELPSFEDFFQQVSECRLDLARYNALIEPMRDAVLISLPFAGAVRGFLVDSFYLSASGTDGAQQYGLLFNAPLDAVGKAFPEFVTRRTVNGYLRRLTSLAEQSRERGANRKTLLVCTGGTPI
jgi:VanZ family protein